MPIAHIVSTPDTCSGEPRVAGTRITVATLDACRRDGWSVEQILAQYPDLTADQVKAAWAYAARQQAKAVLDPEMASATARAVDAALVSTILGNSGVELRRYGAGLELRRTGVEQAHTASPAEMWREMAAEAMDRAGGVATEEGQWISASSIIRALPLLEETRPSVDTYRELADRLRTEAQHLVEITKTLVTDYETGIDGALREGMIDRTEAREGKRLAAEVNEARRRVSITLDDLTKTAKEGAVQDG